jgi:glycosyltransferase involved in cell wall biosynthesis
MAKIIYTGSFRFPDGDAAAARVLGIGKALRAAGHDVIFAGWEEQGRSQDLKMEEGYVYQGFPYIPQGDLPVSSVSPLRRLLRFVRYGQNTLRWLGSQDLQSVNVVIAYHGGSWFVSRLMSLCKCHNIRLIVDCTEWYAPHNLPGGRFGIPFLDNELRTRFFNVATGQVIAISSYLERYYLGRGCNVLRVPPLIDLQDEKWQLYQRSFVSDGVLHLVYAGTPGKKDLLGNALRGLHMLWEERLPVKLHLVGPTHEVVSACLGIEAPLLNVIQDMLIYHGRVPQSDVPQLLARADFSVLLRPEERYAQAGFATKLVESLAAGVPVMANPTSDIAQFVRDGEEGILLDSHSPAAFVIGVKRALALSPEQREEMRTKARVCVERSFDFRVYVKQLETFVQGNSFL